ncbi:MAG: winged helix-turn-helix domain-containing protein [Nitrososphaerales archaeon]
MKKNMSKDMDEKRPRRSKLEQKMEILLRLKERPLSKTQLMSTTMISWKPLKEILDDLRISGAINGPSDGMVKYGTRFKLTNKGTNVLKLYSKLLGKIGNNAN